MGKKIKLVFISKAELNQQVLDFYCLDELCKSFDLEYWDCSDFLYLPQHFVKKLERPYLRKIHSVSEFGQNLNRIPIDAVVFTGLNFCKKNRKVIKVLSKRFPIIVCINFFANTPYSVEVKKESPLAVPMRKKLLSGVKKHIYNSLTIRMFVKTIFHPHQYHAIVNQWQWEKEMNRFEKVVWFSCAMNAEYHINHPDVDQYVRLEQTSQMRCDRYIVYIDQYFPYHTDLKFHTPNLNENQLAGDFFPSMNRYFCFLEKQYDCKVVIAVHPMANYQDNPYEGREMCLFQTAALVRDSLGVCMHSSNALTFVMLFDKPVVSLINGAIRKVPRLNNQILNVTNDWNIPLVDTDVTPYDEQPMEKVNDGVRWAYIEKYFGDFEMQGLRSNAELLKEHCTSVFNSFHQNEAVTKKGEKIALFY